MKKSMRLFVSGSLQPVFYNAFVKENADKLGIKGFIRTLKDGRTEVFVEGHIDSVKQMVPICKRGPQHSMIRNVDEKVESFQGFKDFKIIGF
jgi:acylphosphatase